VSLSLCSRSLSLSLFSLSLSPTIIVKALIPSVGLIARFCFFRALPPSSPLGDAVRLLVLVLVVLSAMNDQQMRRLEEEARYERERWSQRTMCSPSWWYPSSLCKLLFPLVAAADVVLLVAPPPAEPYPPPRPAKDTAEDAPEDEDPIAEETVIL
jgi:hypothetical protein